MHKFKEVLSRNEIAYGTFCALKDPAIIEILGYAGYDFAVIDLEHSALDLMTMEHFIRAAKIANITSVVRTPQKDEATILRAVEAGADAVMVPHLISQEQGKRIVDMAKYAPIGRRGIDGSTRVAKYGNVPMTEHMQQQNDHLLVIGMIEDAEAVENIDEILQVQGLDLLFIGAADLSVSYNLPHQVTHPTVRSAIKTVFEHASRAGMKVGVPAYDAAQAKEVVDLGASFVTSPAVDTYHLTQTLTAHLRSVKNANQRF
ncbi:siderophore biosynthesis protein SbnG [Alicyclobacillus tolerans]|uniref:HpcH/HpaI aldolase family protein n=1 Tax=Alicyclobacillus tolerans TaxID=90970 RepID=UPI001EFF9C86|nr:aldolase/citrate lyase family protein [Alicyclobacillus tolerans]MCF8565569.1 siderophore biosynthesis protein SbnG [Alicyclobacillus tolerans]